MEPSSISVLEDGLFVELLRVLKGRVGEERKKLVWLLNKEMRTQDRAC